MISTVNLLRLPYTRDLTEGGIAYALRSLPYFYQRTGSSPYDHLRRLVAETAVQLAFRRYLSEQNIPFEVKRGLPFTEHEHYDVTFGGRRCEIKSFLISHHDQIAQLEQNPEVLLSAPALVASDQHAGEGHSPHDLYLFAFLAGLVTGSRSELQKVIETKQPHCLVHVMPQAWNRPSSWSPLGRLVMKSEAEASATIEIGGQDREGAFCSHSIELPARQRVEIESGLFSLSYVHIQSNPGARIGISSPLRRQTHVIGAMEWGNIWVYGMDVYLAGYMTREEFSRRASGAERHGAKGAHFIPAGSRVFQHKKTQVKNLALPVSELRSLSELFEHVKLWNA